MRGSKLRGQIDQHLHHRTPAQRLLHSFLQTLERDLPGEQGRERHRAGGGEADRLLLLGRQLELSAAVANCTVPTISPASNPFGYPASLRSWRAFATS